MNTGAQHRQLIILGMLVDAPMYGHQIKERIDVHLSSFSDLKRANLYYLLDRMVAQGYLEARMETMPGGEGDELEATAGVERRVYYITGMGRERFEELLRAVVTDAEMIHSPVDVGIFFLPHLPKAEALELLAERRRTMLAHYNAVLENMKAHPGMSDLHDITMDHVISLYQLELAWLDRARDRLEQSPALRTA